MKWVAIAVIFILVAGGGYIGYLYMQETSNLAEAESEIVGLEGNVSTLEGNVSTLEGNVSTLEGTVSTLEGNVSTLEADLAESEASVLSLEADLTESGALVTTVQADLAESEASVLSLEADLTESEASVSTLEADLAESEESVSSLEAGLQEANDDIKAQQNINSSLSAELNKVQSPRHFSSVQELTDWLHEDDTDTKYADESMAQKACILQVRALRDGYFLGTFLVSDEGICMAYIGEDIYLINPEDDDTEKAEEALEPLPSRPL